ncbi:MAG: transposase [Candidatus Binataceae bacterium]
MDTMRAPYLYLDAIAPPYGARGMWQALRWWGVLANGQKRLLALEMRGSEYFDAWKGLIDNLVGRGLKAPLCVAGGNPGLRKAIELA